MKETDPKIKVLHICSMYPNRINPYDGNFIENHILSTSQRTKPYVLSVHEDPVLSASAIQELSFEKNGILILNIYHGKKKWKLGKLLSRIKLYYSGFKKLNAISGGFNLIHAHVFLFAGIFSWYINKLKIKIPYIVTEHSTRYISGKFSFFERILLQKTAKKAKFILPVSSSLEHAMKKRGIGGNYKVIPNVINTDVFYPQVTRSPDGIKTILHISTLEDSRKNIEGILKAIKKLSLKRQDFKVLIIGESNIPQTQNMMRKLNFDNSCIQLESSKPQEEIATYMRKASFFLLFSRVETFSVVLAEAWSSGIPVVYSKCGGLTDINDPKLGIQVEYENVEGLCSSLDTMLDQCYDYDKEYIRDFVLHTFDSNIVSKQLMEIYAEALK